MRKFLDQGIDFFLAMLLVAMSLIVFLQVFFRYVLNAPLSWPEETARMMLVWLGFIGGYMAMREQKNIGFSLLVNKLPPGLQYKVAVVSKICVAVFLIVVIKEGVFFAYKFLNVRMPYTNVSIGWLVYSVFPISGSLMLFQTILDIVRLLTTNRSQEE